MPETKFTTSFIPKKPIESVGKGGRIKRSSNNLFMIIAMFVFVVALVATAGVFLYEIKLKGDIEDQKINLAQAAKELDREFIDEAVRLNERIKGVEELLDNHLSPSQIFAILEEKTVQTVRFKDLNFNFNGDGDLVLDGKGVAASFESIIQQSDEYGDKGYLRDVLFSSLQNEEGGLVSFSFNSTVNPELILYLNALPEITETFQINDDSNPENNTSDDSSGIIDNMVETDVSSNPEPETGSASTDSGNGIGLPPPTPSPSNESSTTTESGLIENTQ